MCTAQECAFYWEGLNGLHGEVTGDVTFYALTSFYIVPELGHGLMPLLFCQAKSCPPSSVAFSVPAASWPLGDPKVDVGESEVRELGLTGILYGLTPGFEGLQG